MTRRILVFVALAVVFAVSSTMLVQAQAGAAASITGRVTDPAGAVIPGAAVVAVNIATGISNSTQTTSDGIYSFPNLTPGDYNVRVPAAQSFSGAEAKGVHLDVGATRDVDFKLAVAGLATAVEVTSEARLLESTKTDLSTVINEEDVRRLPITSAPVALGVSGVNGNMNDYVGLAATAPGVRFDTSGNSGDVIGPGSFNNRGNLYLVDGGNISDQVVSTRDVPGASVEEVREFEVLTNNYNAEYGQAGGVILNVVTKSGTNGIHGDYHFYARGRNFSASNFFYNAGLASSVCATPPCSVEGLGRAPFFKHEQGITIGGPFIKDKTFWFASYERVAQGVPLQLSPPTGSIATNQPDSELMLSARVDHQLTSNNQLMLRWNQHRILQDNSLVQVPQTAAPDALVSSVVHDHSLNGSLTSTITPHLINEARMFWHRFLSLTPTKSTLPGLRGPNFYFHAAFCCPQGADQNRVQGSDNLSWVHGSHTIKGGVSLNYFPYFSLFQQVHFGLWDFNSAYPFSQPNNSSNPPIQYTFAAGPGAVRAKDNIYGWFLQDTWKMRRNLTLNYGLRWDYEAGGFKGGYIPTSGGGCLMANGLIPACSSDKNNFQPRVGVAWAPQFEHGPLHWLFGDPDKSLVSLGGAEISQLAYLNISLDSLNFDGVTLLTGTVDLTCTTTQSCGPNEQAALAAFPNAVPDSALVPFKPAGSFGRVRPISNHLHNPETRQTSFTIRRELTNSTVLSVGYVGAFGFGQYGERDTNFPSINPDPAHPGFSYLGSRPNPAFGAVRTQENTRTSAYHGLIIDVTKRFSHHVQFHGGYTFSKLLASTEDFYGPSEPGDPRNVRAERGLSYNDARHAVNFGFVFDSERLINTAVAKHIFNNWQVGLNGNLHSGQPYDVSTGNAAFNGSKFFGLGAETSQRPNVLANGTLSVTNIPSYAGGNLNISPSGVAACEAVYGVGNCPAATTFNAPAGASASGPVDSFDGSTVDFKDLSGNLARNAGVGDPFYRFDLSLTRTIPIRERVRIELRADFFNVFNHTNFLGFNGLDALTNFSVPSLTIPVDPNNPSGPQMANPNFNANCTSCLNPFSGQFVGVNGQALRIQDLRQGRVSSKNNINPGLQGIAPYKFNGLGDPTVADIARQIQVSVHVRW